MFSGSDWLSDEGLLRRCANGDESAWRLIVNRYERLVYSIPLRRGMNRDACEDIFQATFISLHSRLDSIQDVRALPKWLAVVASRETSRALRLAGGTVEWLDDLQSIVESDECTAEQTAIESLRSEALANGISKLRPKCRDLLQDLYHRDLAYDSVAEKHDIPIGSVGPTRARCLAALRQLLDESLFL